MRISAVVPAYQNESSVGETVAALVSDSRVVTVIVVDDGSSDGTAARAAAAGARVIRISPTRGKGYALEMGFREAGAADVYLMVDADTGESAREVLALADLVAEGVADMAVGWLPAPGGGGGFGLVKRTASALIRAVSGFRSEAPLSGQRALSPSVLTACRPFAPGFGVDSALTADAVRLGFRVTEVPVSMTHAHRGRSIAGFAHRARQGIDLFVAFIPRLVSMRR